MVRERVLNVVPILIQHWLTLPPQQHIGRAYRFRVDSSASSVRYARRDSHARSIDIRDIDSPYPYTYTVAKEVI